MSVRAQASCHRRASASKRFNLSPSASKSGHPCRRQKKKKAAMSVDCHCNQATTAKSVVVVGALRITKTGLYNRLVNTVGKHVLQKTSPGEIIYTRQNYLHQTKLSQKSGWLYLSRFSEIKVALVKQCWYHSHGDLKTAALLKLNSPRFSVSNHHTKTKPNHTAPNHTKTTSHAYTPV